MAEGKRTFLQLCNLTAGLTGDHGTSDRATIEEFSGTLHNLPQYVSSAWDELCNSRSDWNFLRVDNYITQPLRSGMNVQETKHLLGNDYEDFSHWNESGQFYVIWDDIEETFSSLADYDWLREKSKYSGGTDFITHVAIMPSFDLFVYDTPPESSDVRLRTDWYRRSNALLKDGDTMGIPRQHEMIVVHRALTHYYQSIDDLSRYEIALRDYSSSRAQLMHTQRPPITFKISGL